jgi:hypothetical protein
MMNCKRLTHSTKRALQRQPAAAGCCCAPCRSRYSTCACQMDGTDWTDGGLTNQVTSQQGGTCGGMWASRR